MNLTICCIMGCEKAATKQSNNICHKDHVWYFCDQHFCETMTKKKENEIKK
jgi:hypothetical protein